MLANDKEIFDCVVQHPGLRKARVLMDAMLGLPVWWLSARLVANPKALKACVAISYAVWNDPRVKTLHFSKGFHHKQRKHSKDLKPFQTEEANGTLTYCFPLDVEGRAVGYLGLGGLKQDVRSQTLALLEESLTLILGLCVKTEELGRLSASIRPRAIALSTVHTVHRIINSTLNLDELVSRLAHLTAQVLRVRRCAIYLVEKSSQVVITNGPRREKRGTLTCKALVGYPKNADKKGRVLAGKGIIGEVAQTAEILLRKKFICIPLIDEDIIGVMMVSYKKDKKPFTYFDQEILTTLAEEAVIAIKNAQLYEEQKRVTLGTIQSLAVILGSRVTNAMPPEIFLRMVLRLAQELRLNEEDTQALHYATLLKDTAKIGIPDEILKKPTKLTGEEYQLLRDHPIKGAKIVQSFESLKPVAPIILYSREKYDGTGYPEGLKGEHIPVGARVLAVINAFEAIMFGRPYKDQASLTEALDEIRRNSGTQFDPRVVDAFMRIVEKEGFYKVLKHA